MSFVNLLLPTIEHLGVFGYWFIFLISFLESLAFVGSIVPGAVIIVFMGLLSSQGYLDIGNLIWFAAIGAIMGDGLSYYLGTKGTHFFKEGNKILKVSHLNKGKRFFKKYGDKSIFLGRFIGLLRPIIPFVAGLTGMNLRIFLFWNVVSAFLWVASHLLLGYFFGEALTVVEVWSSRLGIFLIAVVIFGFGIWFVVKKSHKIFTFFKSIIFSIIEAIVHNSEVKKLVQQNPKIFSFLKKRFQKNNFFGLPLTFLGVSFIYVLFSFFGIVEDVLVSDLIVSLDIRLANLLYAFRDPVLIKIFLWITILGKGQIVFSVAAIASTFFWLLKKRIYILSLWITLLGSELFVFVGKLLIHRSRPGELIPFYQETSLSFPSGHATIAVALYGFLLYFLWKHFQELKWKSTLLFAGCIIIFLIGLSRIYLGVHYLSDVLGGYLVGLLGLIIGISITEWYISKHKISYFLSIPKNFKYITTCLIVCEVIFYIVYASRYQPLLTMYTPPVTPSVINPIDIFSSEKNSRLKYTEGLLGQPQEPISFMVVAKDNQFLIQAFKEAGWSGADAVGIKSLLHASMAAIFHQTYPTAPITPSFWNSNVHDFGFEKPTETNIVNERHHARFWKTNTQTPEGQFIYVGTVSLDKGVKWGVTHKIKPDLDTERELLFTDLQKAGVVIKYQKLQLVNPVIGQNFSGDQFFTDGGGYIITLKK